MSNVDRAIMNLRPGAEWFMDNDDVENITWLTAGVAPLSVADVDAEIARLNGELAQAEVERITGIQNAQAELKALGLSDAAVATISGYPYPYSPAV